MYRKYLKRWLDFVIVLCVLAVIWPILLLVTLWLHFANKRSGCLLHSGTSRTKRKNIQGNQVQNNDGRT